ncbi:MAG: 2-amino-4-hydroxy-6-hydroxymethyldihydropteridine diphosphokinase [bacterium]
MSFKEVYLGFGSNIGDRKNNIIKSYEMIEKLPNTKIIKQSSFYETEPIGIKNQPKFINTVIKIKTFFSPIDLIQHLSIIEKKIGKKKEYKWGPRIIDIDILFYEKIIFKNDFLEIPHSEMIQRKFVLIPLAEIDENILHPVENKNIKELLKEVSDESEVNFYS